MMHTSGLYDFINWATENQLFSIWVAVARGRTEMRIDNRKRRSDGRPQRQTRSGRVQSQEIRDADRAEIFLDSDGRRKTPRPNEKSEDRGSKN